MLTKKKKVSKKESGAKENALLSAKLTFSFRNIEHKWANLTHVSNALYSPPFVLTGFGARPVGVYSVPPPWTVRVGPDYSRSLSGCLASAVHIAAHLLGGSKDWPVYEERCPAIQAAHPPHDWQCVARESGIKCDLRFEHGTSRTRCLLCRVVRRNFWLPVISFSFLFNYLMYVRLCVAFRETKKLHRLPFYCEWCGVLAGRWQHCCLAALKMAAYVAVKHSCTP